MPTFTTIDATGEVIAYFSVSDDENMRLNTPGGATAVMGDPPPDNSYYGNGEWVQKPPQPSSVSRWNAITKIWYDPRTLEQLKGAKWAKVKSTRETAVGAGFVWSGSTFDSDDAARQNIQGAAQFAAQSIAVVQPFSVDWTLADNTVRTLTGADMLAVGQAMGVHIMTIHGIGRTLRTAIESATTAAAVEAVTWPA